MIKDVKEKNLPEVNDDFAKNAGSENVAELREKVKIGLQQRADESLKKDFENRLIKALIEQSTIEFPQFSLKRKLTI